MIDTKDNIPDFNMVPMAKISFVFIISQNENSQVFNKTDALTLIISQ